MCGRYAAASSTDELVEELEVEADRTGSPGRTLLRSPQEPPAGEPDYNLAPTKLARVVLARPVKPEPPRAPVADGSARTGAPSVDGSAHAEGLPVRQLRLLSWGLVPSWSKDPRSGARLANARAETVLEKPAFARAARSRRCLVPATGWYEWQASPVAKDRKGKPRRQPFFVHRGDAAPMTFAGLYEFWRDPQAPPDDPSAWLTSFTIITTAAEAGLDRIHDRQPLVLDPQDWAVWLSADSGPDEVSLLLTPGRPGRFDAYPIDPQVGDVRRNGPGLLQRLPVEALVGVVDPMTGEVIG